MRVCFIVNQIAAWGKLGGFGVNTRRLGGALSERGVDVHVVVPRRAGQGRTERLDGMTVHGISPAEVAFGSGVYRAIDADLYHAQEPTVCAYHAQRAVPHRVHLATCRDPRGPADWWLEVRHASWSRRMKAPLQRFYYEGGPLVRAAVHAARGVFVEAEFLKEKARRLYGLREVPEVLPIGVEPPARPPVKALRPTCLLAGRLDRRKRPELVLELAERRPDIAFIVVGRAHEPAVQAELERRAARLANVELTGFLDPFADARFHDVFERAWILVHPAAREGMPTVFKEASAYGAAIVSFLECGGYVEAFGRVVPPAEGVGGLERALENLIQTGAWRELGARGAEFVRHSYSLRATVDRHLAAYRAALNDDAARPARARSSDPMPAAERPGPMPRS